MCTDGCWLFKDNREDELGDVLNHRVCRTCVGATFLFVSMCNREAPQAESRAELVQTEIVIEVLPIALYVWALRARTECTGCKYQ